ncbi:DUF6475 domain-containing protein [Variovorax boronicumulans]|uniref:DUF6475 domain-containing protein n=1 Tax=Variovorax boronicumulans TaxID=436515 RepID=UPI0012E607E4|nr:DUF6475 domain-containing protein [Variovorax boronicumulans]GER21282.1 hypothetical protein VCH24_63290 [Variovorax boronicumulans]
MQPSERLEFARLFADVMAYYRQDVSDFTRSLFWTACEGASLEQVRKAFDWHAKDPEHGQFAPKVADLVRIIAGTHTDRAQLAWGKALEAMGSVGAYTDVVFDDPAIHACIEDLGGWPKVCRTETKELSYLQHRFCESHKAYTGRGQFAYPRRLSGDRSPDSEYQKKGLKPPRPALIGDAARCKLVYQGGSAAGKTVIGYASFAELASAGVMHGIEVEGVH